MIILLISLRFGFSLYYVLLCQLAAFRSFARSSTTNKCTSVRALSTLEIMRQRDTGDIARIDCLRLHAKPLNAVIGRVFASYRPERTAGSNAKKKRRKSTILASRFARPVGAPVRNQAHRHTEGVQGYPGSHWLTPPGEYCGRYMPSVSVFPFFLGFFHRQPAFQQVKMTSRPLIT
jgi:hypothetical protein